MFFAQANPATANSQSNIEAAMASSGASTLTDKIMTYLVTSGFDLAKSIVAALIIVFIGWLIGRWVGKGVSRWLEKVELEPPVKILIIRIVRLLILAVTLLIVADKMGVNVVPLLTGAGVIGLGVGLAMQGVLSNVVAGLSIIFTKPYRVGQYVSLLGVEGRVENIELFSTTLSHPDLSRVVIPNRKIVGEILHNYGNIRQLDLTVGVAYGSNIPRVLTIVKEVLAASPKTLKEPTPVIGVTMLADSSINVSIRPWVKVQDFGSAKIDLYQEILSQFEQHQISIPFPQREIRVIQGALSSMQSS